MRMNDTQSQTESLLNIIKSIDNREIMLPEFQRDFRWELAQTYDLIDSLIRDIFIGTIIYGKPSFGMTLREIDKRPRKGRGSNAPLVVENVSKSDIINRSLTKNLRIVLDGQQRLTSLYRAITGLDKVYVILKQDVHTSEADFQLEDVIDDVRGEEDKEAISISLLDAYEKETKLLEDDDLAQRFEATSYYHSVVVYMDDAERRLAIRAFRRAVNKLLDLYKQQKMVAFYLLDMSLDKFCTFFERSNSRGIQLNFTDILAAKLYYGFNLRKQIEEFDGKGRYHLNREIVVRALAYLVFKESGRALKIDKQAILEGLDADDFNRYWNEVCKLYKDSLDYLTEQHYILSQDWMPSENMIVPIMIFLREIKSFDRMNENQRKFLEFWYWSSVFSNRYSTASNEAIITDCEALHNVAKGSKINSRGYFVRLRSLIKEPSDLFSYTKRSSAVYRGTLNFVGYIGKGLSNWNNTGTIDVSMRLEDHHIFPRAYIASCSTLEDISVEDAEQLVDSVVNRTLIPKILNIQIGKKSPHQYLSELQQKNPGLGQCLSKHLLPSDLITDRTWDTFFRLFMDERAEQIYTRIAEYTSDCMADAIATYGTQIDADIPNPIRLASLSDLYAAGKIHKGDRLYVKKQPDQFAILVDDKSVDFNGKNLLINAWGQQMTGWPSISIYSSVYLERTKETIGKLRE